MGSKRAVVSVVALLVAPSLLALAASPASAALTIDAPGWIVIWPGQGNQSGRRVFAPGDVTGDGVDDLLLSYAPRFNLGRPDLFFSNSFELFEGSESGLGTAPLSFSNGSDGGYFIDTTSVAWPKGWDFNGDGRADVALGGGGQIAIPEDMSTRIDIWLGSTDGYARQSSCWKRVSGYLGDGFSPAAWVPVRDLNGDGADDIVAIRNPGFILDPNQDPGSNASLTIIRGGPTCTNETVTPTLWLTPEAGGVMDPIGAADFNGDGYGDLVVDEGTSSSTGAATHRLRVYAGNADNLSSPGPSVSIVTNGGLRFFVGPDINGDNLPDMAVGAGGSSIGGGEYFELAYYRGSRGGLVLSNPASVRLVGVGVSAASSSLGDVNGDGSVDVVLTSSDVNGSTDRITSRLYLGQGGRIHERPDWVSTATVSGYDPASFNDAASTLEAGGDVDGDGLSDIVVLAGATQFGSIDLGEPTGSNYSAILVFYGRQVVQALAGVGPVGFNRGVAYPTYEYGFDVTARAAAPTAFDRVAVATPAGDFVYRPANDTFAFEPNTTLGTVEFVRMHASSSASFEGTEPAWNIHFRFEFTWDFPLEDEVPFRLVATGPSVPPPRPTPPAGAFRVEKDLEFGGTLVVSNATTGAPLSPGAWVAGGAGLTASGLGVHFQDAPAYPAPPGAFSWLGADDGGASWSQGPGAGMLNLSFTADVNSDPSDQFVVTLSGLPNAEVGVPTLSFPFGVDSWPALFAGALPANDTWVASHDVTIAVQVLDNLSGVDPSRIEYQVSTSGPSGWGTWHNATLDGTNLTAASAVAVVNFLDGEGNYFRFRVWDAVGNGPSLSDAFQVRVDTLHVTFANPAPSSTAWQNTSSVTAAVSIQDLGASGVDPSSVAYRQSNDGLFGFGSWVDVPGLAQATLVRPETAFPLQEGDQNFIQWRAEDVVGTGLTVSPAYRVIDDTTPPQVGPVDPSPAGRLTSASLRVHVDVRDGGLPGTARSGLNATAIEYSFRPAGGNDSGWTRAGLQVTDGEGGNLTALVPLTLAPGPGNEVRFRVSDVAGNGPVVSPTASYHLNRAPAVNLTTNATNDTVTTGSNITLIAIVDDPDHDPVAYAWFDGTTQVGDNSTPEVSLALPLGNWTLRVVATDPFGAETAGNITVHVVDEPPAPPPPPPPSHPRQAGDNSLALLLLLIVAGAVGVAVVITRRRRAPPGAGP